MLYYIVAGIFLTQTLTKPGSRSIGRTSQDGFKVPTMNPRGNRPSMKLPHQASIHEEFFSTPIPGAGGK